MGEVGQSLWPCLGFTLLETIIVLVVLGLAAGIVISRGPMRSPRVELHSVATMLLQGMRAARAQAIASDHDTPFSLDPLHHAYHVGDGPPQALPAGVAVQLSVGGKPARAIDFAADGSSSGGELVVAVAKQRMVVTVNWLTGRMQVAEGAP